MAVLSCCMFKCKDSNCPPTVGKRANIHSQRGNCGTALQAACRACAGYTAIFLLDKRADINIQLGKYGNEVPAALSVDQRQFADDLFGRGGFIYPNGPSYKRLWKTSRMKRPINYFWASRTGTEKVCLRGCMRRVRSLCTSTWGRALS